MITFRIASRLKVCKDMMVKYNRTDLFPLLLKHPFWIAKDGEAVWCREDNLYNPNIPSSHNIPNEIFDLMKANRYIVAWGNKYYNSFDTALIAYTKALKKYIRTNKLSD